MVAMDTPNKSASSDGREAAPAKRLRRPVLLFLLGAYGWAWVLWGYWVPNMGTAGIEIGGVFLLCAIGGGFGPSIAALTLAARSGHGEIQRLLSGLANNRVRLKWYAFAVLAVPAITALSLPLQSLVVGPPHWPAGGPPIVLGIAWPIMAALGEELG